MADLPAEVASGDRRRALVAVRDRLAVTLEGAEPQHVAGLAKQLAAVLSELGSLPASGKVNAVDELKKRRAARSPVVDGSEGKVKRRG